MTWYAVGIMIGEAIPADDLNKPLQMGSGVRIERIPEWVKHSESTAMMSWHDRNIVEHARSAFACEYEAAALGSSDPEWTGEGTRSIQSAVDEKFVLASLALWLIRPSRMTCGPVIHFGSTGDSATMRTTSTFDPLLTSPADANNVIVGSEVEFAAKLFAAISALPRNGTRWLAMRMLIRALQESMWEMRFLFLWVVLEALFGSSQAGETSFRISQRIALFLSNGGNYGEKVFAEAREGYRWRSKVVHGTQLRSLKGELSNELVARAETYIRSTMRQVLLDASLGTVFDSSEREGFLDSLVFRNDGSGPQAT